MAAIEIAISIDAKALDAVAVGGNQLLIGADVELPIARISPSSVTSLQDEKSFAIQGQQRRLIVCDNCSLRKVTTDNTNLDAAADLNWIGPRAAGSWRRTQQQRLRGKCD